MDDSVHRDGYDRRSESSAHSLLLCRDGWGV